jgi:hypothetical protein
MNEFDQFVKHKLKVKNYARYTDDFVIVSDNIDYLQNILPSIRAFLKEKLLLDLHPRKVEIRRCTRGIDFLGYVVLPYHTVVRTKTKKRMMRKLREQVTRFRNGQINEATLKGSLQSYMGVLSHADAHILGQELESQFWYWVKE